MSRASALTFSPASIRAACVGLAHMLMLASSANAAEISVSLSSAVTQGEM